MGKMRFVLAIVGAISVLIVAYIVLRGISSFHQGYLWKEMDWNQDGTTSISEFFVASDIGTRETMIDGKKCVEYFAYKDGLPVKVNCVGVKVPGKN